MNSNAMLQVTSSSKHQPRSWSKAEAEKNIPEMSVTLSSLQSLRSWSKAVAYMNILPIA